MARIYGNNTSSNCPPNLWYLPSPSPSKTGFLVISVKVCRRGILGETTIFSKGGLPFPLILAIGGRDPEPTRSIFTLQDRGAVTVADQVLYMNFLFSTTTVCAAIESGATHVYLTLLVCTCQLRLQSIPSPSHPTNKPIQPPASRITPLSILGFPLVGLAAAGVSSSLPRVPPMRGAGLGVQAVAVAGCRSVTGSLVKDQASISVGFALILN
jgi:hypothetical protein